MEVSELCPKEKGPVFCSGSKVFCSYNKVFCSGIKVFCSGAKVFCSGTKVFILVPSKSTKMLLSVELKLYKVEMEGHFCSSAGG